MGAAPIDPDEPILRRIPVKQGYYDPRKVPPVEAGSFRPNSNDTDGLSFYLEREISAQDLAASGNPDTQYVVARLLARDLCAQGLTLVADQQPGDLPGHLITPEINIHTYSNSHTRPRIKEVCRALTRIANQNIAYQPPASS